MPTSPTSFLDLKSFSSSDLHSFFSRVTHLKKASPASISSGERVALLFFEPSTRTRMSFESAAYRSGFGPLIFDGGANTSLEKGETVEDSILNIAAMRPKFLVIRCGDQVDLRALSQQVEMPIINAGWGIKGHPTQALLDVFTMSEYCPSLTGLRVLILGDVRHSRVAASHFELLPKLGIEVGLCGPSEFLVEQPDIKKFRSLPEALSWAQVVMALRVQFERHDQSPAEKNKPLLDREDYRASFGLNSRVLRDFDPAGIIMHPGPINHGLELESEVLQDPRCKVLQQVTNGVFVREQLLRDLYVN